MRYFWGIKRQSKQLKSLIMVYSCMHFVIFNRTTTLFYIFRSQLRFLWLLQILSCTSTVHYMKLPQNFVTRILIVMSIHYAAVTVVCYFNYSIILLDVLLLLYNYVYIYLYFYFIFWIIYVYIYWYFSSTFWIKMQNVKNS